MTGRHAFGNGQTAAAVIVLAAAIVLATAMLVWFSPVVLAAEHPLAPSPNATSGPFMAVGDIRSDGGGPGLESSPLVIMASVVLLGAVTMALTVLVARFAKRT